MRTSLGDHLPALRRQAGLAALAAACGGVVVAMTPRLGLWRLTAEVQALDTVGTQHVAVLSGAATSDLAWGLSAVGVVIVGLAVLVAVDRPAPHAEALLVGAGAAVLASWGVLLAQRPATSAFAGRPGVADLLGDDVTLPTGVAIELGVTPAMGLWALAAAAGLVIAGTLVALRRG